MTAQLGALHIAWLGKRGIDLETALSLGIFTGGRTSAGEVTPNEAGDILVFPQIENGVIVNAKYRAPGKKFWQMKGGEASFFNADILKDPGLTDGTYPLIITEGEMDTLAVITAGYPHAVSVPDGAPPPGEASDLTRDETGKFAFMYRHRARLREIKKFILCVDGDAPGQQLAKELVRRLGAARCSYVTYPHGCKDANDVLLAEGRAGVARLINEAKPYPVAGLFQPDDYPETAVPPLLKTGWASVDDLLKPYQGELMIVTGVPGHGKSTWTLHLCANLAEKYGYVVALASFEMSPVPYVRDVLRHHQARKWWNSCDDVEKEKITRWINGHFVFIDDVEDEEQSLEWVCEKAEDAVARYDAKVLVIDPWNQIEHRRKGNENGEEYIARALRALRRLAKVLNLIVILVVHPTKDVRNAKDGKVRRPTLYDVSGAAHWYNAADHGIVVWREDANRNRTQIHIEKSRYSHAGRRGFAELQYSAVGRFENVEDDTILQMEA